MSWLYLLIIRLPRSWFCNFCVIFLTQLLLNDLFNILFIILFLTCFGLHSFLYLLLQYQWLISYVCLSFCVYWSNQRVNQVVTLIFHPEPSTRILQFTIISIVVIIMEFLYIMLSLLLVTSIIIWFPCWRCYCGLTSL